MQPVSDDFMATLPTSHRMYTLCEVFQGGVVSGNAPVELKILDGNVTVDDVAIRRRADITLTDHTGEFTPDSVNDLLTPLGTEVRLWRGVYLKSTGAVEKVPLITGGLSDIQIDDSGAGLHIRMDIYDRSRKVARAKLPHEWVVVPSTPYVTAISDILGSRFPTIQMNFSNALTSHIAPLLVFQTGSDPWKHATDMATAIGCDLFFDPMGECLLQPKPFDTFPVDKYIEGVNGAKLLYINKRMQDEGIYNHVVVTGESSANNPPVSAEAFDDNPLSSTYYLGPMGDVVYPYVGNSFITQTAQAQDIANYLLSKKVGAVETVQITGMVNPALDLNDTIEVKREQSKVDAWYVIDKITVPLTFARGISLSSRQRVFG